MAYQYTTPDFLKNQSAAEIHRRMLNNLPNNIDTSEGQIIWDFTRPTAIEKAELVEFELNEMIQIMFVQWAYGGWLDEHARANGISRREANRASGEVTVTAVRGTVLPQGFQFATPANLTSSIVFETLEETVFDGTADEQGYIVKRVAVRAIEGGTEGNVPVDSIKLMVKPLSGIVLVRNEAAISGGTEQEDDDTLRNRILELFQYGASFTGNEADYIRWAKEVPAVGSVIVESEWNDPDMPSQFHFVDGLGNEKCVGCVRLIVVDSNGEPANKQIVDEVYEHIVSPDDSVKRLAPIGAYVTVDAPEAIEINISANVILQENQDITAVTELFKKNLSGY